MTDYSGYNPNELNDFFTDACLKGELDVVQYLLTTPDLSTHADIHFDDDRGVRYACSNGNLPMVQYLLSSPDLSEHADIHRLNDYICLGSACFNGHLEVVKYLLASPQLHEHAHIHAADDLALRWAMEAEKHEVVNFMLYDMAMSVKDETYLLILHEPHRIDLMHRVAQRDLFFKINHSLVHSAEKSSGTSPQRPKI